MLNRLLSVVGKTLMVLGVLLLAFVGYQLWGTSLEQSRHQDDLTNQLAQEVAPTSGSSEGSSLGDVSKELEAIDPATAPPLAAPPEGSPVGIIEIEKIGVNQVVVEGVTKADLKKGPGHYPGTPLPGQAGNAAIAGHRTTYGAPFNRIDELVPGDVIYVTTQQGRFRYEVVPPPTTGVENGPGWFSVLPSQNEVLANTEDNRLTLTACHPKRSAKQRIIVTARLTVEPAAAAPAPTETAQPTPTDDTALFAGDPDAKGPAIAFGLGALAVWILAWWVGRWWKRWASIVIFAVPFLLLVWGCFVYTDRWLPSL